MVREGPQLLKRTARNHSAQVKEKSQGGRLPLTGEKEHSSIKALSKNLRGIHESKRPESAGGKGEGGGGGGLQTGA